MYVHAICMSLVCYLYVSGMYSYVTRMSLNALVCHVYVTRVYFVTHMYSYVTHMSLVCSRMSFICAFNKCLIIVITMYLTEHVLIK